MAADTREELLGWIANTKRTQKKLALALGTAAVISLVLIIAIGTVGGFAMTFTVLVAICSFWITGAHITDWRHRITALDRPKNIVIGGGRRW